MLRHTFYNGREKEFSRKSRSVFLFLLSDNPYLCPLCDFSEILFYGWGRNVIPVWKEETERIGETLEKPVEQNSEQMKILAVGMNYVEHNKELDGTLDIPREPVIFTKADSALLKDGKPFFIPDFTEQCDYETEIVVRICRLGKNIAPRFASRYYDAVTVGIDFTARDLQRKLRKAGQPWEICKGFDNSAVIGDFVPVDRFPDIQNMDFRLDINGKTAQQGNTRDMIFPVDALIAYVSRFFTLKIGDLIYTGTPAGVGPVHIGEHLEGYIGDCKLLEFNVR